MSKLIIIVSSSVSILALLNFILNFIMKFLVNHYHETEENEMSFVSPIIPLLNLVDIKVKMNEEKSTNHEFVKKKEFTAKLLESSESFEKYKKESSYSICDEYKGG